MGTISNILRNMKFAIRISTTECPRRTKALTHVHDLPIVVMNTHVVDLIGARPRSLLLPARRHVVEQSPEPFNVLPVEHSGVLGEMHSKRRLALVLVGVQMEFWYFPDDVEERVVEVDAFGEVGHTIPKFLPVLAVHVVRVQHQLDRAPSCVCRTR